METQFSRALAAPFISAKTPVPTTQPSHLKALLLAPSPFRGPDVIFQNATTAGDGIFMNEGGLVSGGSGGRTDFASTSSAESATLIAEDGLVNDAEGGTILFYEQASGGTARIALFGNGALDISLHLDPGLTTGSAEGSGSIFLGAEELAVGTNNLSTLFSGVIQDGGLNGGAHGSLRKIGTGTITLSGANLYTGGTTINLGTLLVISKTGSGTGSGPVQISGGILGGTGRIRRAV